MAIDYDSYYVNSENQRRPTFNFNYWMPPVDLADGVTDFYELPPFQKYIRLLYYVILLIMGNDIGP